MLRHPCSQPGGDNCRSASIIVRAFGRPNENVGLACGKCQRGWSIALYKFDVYEGCQCWRPFIASSALVNIGDSASRYWRPRLLAQMSVITFTTRSTLYRFGSVTNARHDCCNAPMRRFERNCASSDGNPVRTHQLGRCKPVRDGWTPSGFGGRTPTSGGLAQKGAGR